jgi:Ca2+-binding RTX toxin-like protein
VLSGGAGHDTASYQASASAVTIDLVTGVATGGDAQSDSFFEIEQFVGSAFDDTISGGLWRDYLVGGQGADRLTGRGGDDFLSGDDGDDVLKGGEGNDALLGGAGSDSLRGGAGSDRFTFLEIAGADRIEDFEVGLDTIYIDDATYADVEFSTVGNDTLLSIDGQSNTILLVGVHAADLSVSDFVF